jgi:hypothetical protein
MTAGEICRYHFFVLKGCLRKFYITSKGSEQTTEFAIETWWLTDNMAYEHQLRTDFSIQAVENSEVLVIEYQDQERLIERASCNGATSDMFISVLMLQHKCG